MRRSGRRSIIDLSSMKALVRGPKVNCSLRPTQRPCWAPIILYFTLDRKERNCQLARARLANAGRVLEDAYSHCHGIGIKLVLENLLQLFAGRTDNFALVGQKGSTRELEFVWTPAMPFWKRPHRYCPTVFNSFDHDSR